MKYGKRKRLQHYEDNSATSLDDDISVLQRQANPNECGAKQICYSLQDGTLEIKNVLLNECDIIYECKICRNLFRSFENIVAHKRAYCCTHYVNPKRLSHDDENSEIQQQQSSSFLKNIDPSNQFDRNDSEIAMNSNSMVVNNDLQNSVNQNEETTLELSGINYENLCKHDIFYSNEGDTLVSQQEDDGYETSYNRFVGLENNKIDPPRRCLLQRWPDYQGYGFSIQYHGSGEHRICDLVDNSPAKSGGLRNGDFLVEINEQNVKNMATDTVKKLVSEMPDVVEIIAVSLRCKQFYESKKVEVNGTMDNVEYHETPESQDQFKGQSTSLDKNESARNIIEKEVSSDELLKNDEYNIPVEIVLPNIIKFSTKVDNNISTTIDEAHKIIEINEKKTDNINVELSTIRKAECDGTITSGEYGASSVSDEALHFIELVPNDDEITGPKKKESNVEKKRTYCGPISKHSSSFKEYIHKEKERHVKINDTLKNDTKKIEEPENAKILTNQTDNEKKNQVRSESSLNRDDYNYLMKLSKPSVMNSVSSSLESSGFEKKEILKPASIIKVIESTVSRKQRILRWICRSCNFPNYPNRVSCYDCGEKKGYQGDSSFDREVNQQDDKEKKQNPAEGPSYGEDGDIRENDDFADGDGFNDDDIDIDDDKCNKNISLHKSIGTIESENSKLEPPSKKMIEKKVTDKKKRLHNRPGKIARKERRKDVNKRTPRITHRDLDHQLDDYWCEKTQEKNENKEEKMLTKEHAAHLKI